MTALGHSQDAVARHKHDVWAVGVMGLIWLSPTGTVPFGPFRAQEKTSDETKQALRQKHMDWVRQFQHNLYQS